MVEGAIVIGLATFTLVFMLKDLDGPWSIFERLRCWIDEVKDYKIVHPFLSSLWDCAWCLSTWVSMPLTALYIIITGNKLWVAVLFLWLISIAVSGLVYLIVTTLDEVVFRLRGG